VTRDDLIQHLWQITPRNCHDLTAALNLPDAVGMAVAAPRGNDE
jgi:hypothetical protein